MFTVPLPFVVMPLFVFALYRAVRHADVPGSKWSFFAFLCLCLLQGLIVGLRFGYGVDALMPLQPVTASAMPPLAFLGFRTLVEARIAKAWVHALPVVAVLLAVLAARMLVDPLLFCIFIGYGILLLRLVTGPGFARAGLNTLPLALRAAQLTGLLLIFFGLTDGALVLYVTVNGNADVPVAVGLINLGVIAILLVFFAVPARLPVAVETTVADPRDDEIVQSLLTALDTNDIYRREDLSLARLAKAVRLPARDVSAAINRATGLNVSQFVNNRRIAEACRLLTETRAPVTQIMFDCGFSTKSNFNREFRRVTGVSPSQWRAEKRATEAKTPAVIPDATGPEHFI
ncbi:helix-turn-helix transcriptional regulator [Rhizobium sp. CFBP 8762]|uniref:helix-turn-helix domain-containing protein n=1 Tax=Rhizobium sp. CFBP 8762 TaxID=2775279 RepID=UPI001784C234|nr:AraC family transcriptional regulator [Rhizobium sp. CFBP 8762]MBD8553687.1 helix-turn-helix transcriptional regulator [Rhizobium sp. CFBP 8762]